MVAKTVPFDTEGTLANFIRAYDISDDEKPAIIIIEAIANSIDAKATEIWIDLQHKQENRVSLKVRDNGTGMNRTIFESNYHKFSVSSKTVGDGIGFAGVGAKLAFDFHKQTSIRTTTKTNETSEMLCSTMNWNVFDKNIEWDYTRMYNHDKEFLDDNEHGTTYEVELDPKTGRYFWENCGKIISKWYNSILLGHYPISIFLNSEKLESKERSYEKTKHKEIKVDNNTVQLYFYVLKNKPDEPEEELNFVVYGKFIRTDYMNWGGRIKPEYENRIHVIVEADALARELVFNKQNFKPYSKLYLAIKKKIAQELNDWLVEIGALRETTDLTPNKTMNKLSEILSSLLNKKDFKDFNPFLRNIKSPTIFQSEDGPLSGTFVEGTQITTGTDGSDGAGGGTEVIGNEGGGVAVALAENEKMEIKAEERQRIRKGIAIIPQNDDKDKREAWVDIGRKAIIINQGHRFYKAASRSPSEIKNMQLFKAVVDALAYDSAEKPEFNNNYRVIADKKLDLLNAIMQNV